MCALVEFLKTVDVPEARKDISEFRNVQWLINNLPIRNRELPGFYSAIEELRQMLKTHLCRMKINRE